MRESDKIPFERETRQADADDGCSGKDRSGEVDSLREVSPEHSQKGVSRPLAEPVQLGCAFPRGGHGILKLQIDRFKKRSERAGIGKGRAEHQMVSLHLVQMEVHTMRCGGESLCAAVVGEGDRCGLNPELSGLEGACKDRDLIGRRAAQSLSHLLEWRECRGEENRGSKPFEIASQPGRGVAAKNPHTVFVRRHHHGAGFVLGLQRANPPAKRRPDFNPILHR